MRWRGRGMRRLGEDEIEPSQSWVRGRFMQIQKINPSPFPLPKFGERVKGLAFAIAVFASAWGVTSALAGPQRIVSMYPCLDTMLVHLADRSQIAALSRYAREPRSSTVADVAKTLPMTFETAEEIVALKPDLVLTSIYAPQATRSALRRMGIPTAEFNVPLNVAESVAQIRAMAEVVAQPARGEALVASIDAALAAAAPPAGEAPLTALVFQSNGFAAGGGVLIDELLARTGFQNVGARYQLGQFGIVSLEQLIADPPQILLAGTFVSDELTWGDRIAAHPALAGTNGGMARAQFPENLLLCGGPVIVQTLAVLADARRRYDQAPR